MAASWLLGLAVACFSRRWRYAAIGWCLGVPVSLTIALVYNYGVWGLWGYSPTIP